MALFFDRTLFKYEGHMMQCHLSCRCKHWGNFSVINSIWINLHSKMYKYVSGVCSRQAAVQRLLLVRRLNLRPPGFKRIKLKGLFVNAISHLWKSAGTLFTVGMSSYVLRILMPPPPPTFVIPAPVSRKRPREAAAEDPVTVPSKAPSMGMFSPIGRFCLGLSAFLGAMH